MEIINPEEKHDKECHIRRRQERNGEHLVVFIHHAGTEVRQHRQNIRHQNAQKSPVHPDWKAGSGEIVDQQNRQHHGTRQNKSIIPHIIYLSFRCRTLRNRSGTGPFLSGCFPAVSEVSQTPGEPKVLSARLPGSMSRIISHSFRVCH